MLGRGRPGDDRQASLGTAVRVQGAAGAPRRVFVTGAAGSGKTVLARRLAGRLGVPHVELDTTRGRPGEIDEDRGWIVEGTFVWDVERFLAVADTIVWLDLPPIRTIPRILRRHIRLSVSGRNPHRGLRLLLRFVLAQRAYFQASERAPEGPADWSAITRSNHQAMVRNHHDRLVRLTSPRDVRRWLASVGDPTTTERHR